MAWKHAWGSEEEYKRFNNAVIKHFKNGCPICHGNKILMYDSLTYRRIGKKRHQFFSVLCSNCGHLMEFELERFMKQIENV